jgi:hypothetical protein
LSLKCFITADGFLFIPVTKVVGGNKVTTKNIETFLEANMENGLELQALKKSFCFVIKNAIKNHAIMKSSLTCAKVINFNRLKRRCEVKALFINIF